MAATLAARPSVYIRDAEPSDNHALIDLAAACPMEGDITLAMTRAPDFFQLNRLEGAQWRVGVAEVDGQVVGCVMGADRRAYLHGVERTTLYAGDLKVHPAFRGTGVADALSEWVRCALAEMAGSDVPILLTILGGNRAMERRTVGRGSVPRFERFATIRAHSIPLLLPRRFGDRSLRCRRATVNEIEEMAGFWCAVAPTRQFAPVHTADSLAEWIANAPGLEISDFRLVRDRGGRLLGFLAWWDQSSFKQLRVIRYSARLRVVRTVINGIARLTRSVTLPDLGAPLRYCTAVHVCVSPERPEVLRTLVQSTYGELRDARYAAATIGLDMRDPLRGALGGLFAQPTDSHAYVCTSIGDYAGPSLADRPLHYEIALV
jgi:GNAT superfamily N-acetyltransferase